MSVDEEDPRPGARTVTAHHEGVLDRRTWTDEAARYELGDEIASGGGGRVVEARDGRLGREVAIKLPFDAVGSLRLLREAQLMARLEHPSIVSVHDLARDREGTPFYVMKRLAGETLRERIEGRSFEERIALLPTLIAIADAVAYAHHRGIIHRDLKPANVIVGEFGETSVIDWGLARMVGGDGDEAPAEPVEGADVTVQGAVVGTPSYMPPEQARGEPVDQRADVYGLGALCYHVLAGEPPYRGSSAIEVVERVLEGPPRPLAERQPRVPADLAAIVAKAMGREPADRYPSAQQLAADLRAYQAGRLVAAHRYSPWARLLRRARRHRGALVAVGAAVAAAAAIAIAWPSGAADPRAMCALAGDRVASLWSPAVRAGVVARVIASAGPGASTASGAIADRLDGYAGALREARIEACEATQVRGEQSAELLDRRMACLDRRAADLRAAIGLFDRVAPREIAALVRAVGGLPSLARCASPESLAEARALPDDPVARAAVAARYDQIAVGRAYLNAGRYPQALEVARAVVAAPGEPEATPYAAEAYHLLGAVLLEQSKYDAAAPELHRALVLAELGHEEDERAAVLYYIARAAVEQRQPAEAERRLRELGALATRTGDLVRQALRFELESQLADARGEYQRSIELERQSTELAERAGNTIHTYSGWANIGGALILIGRYADAESYVRRALDARARTYGRDHPNHARSLNSLATIYLNTGRAADAIPLLHEAVGVIRSAGLADTDELLGFRSTLADALSMLGRYDESEVERVAVFDALGDDHPMKGVMMDNLGRNRLLARQPERAEPWLRRGVAHTEAHLGAKHPQTANARHSLALALIERGDARGALPLLEAALEVQLREQGPDGHHVALVRAGLARAHLELGQPARALVLGDQALEVHTKHPDARARGELRWVLARALHATRGDPARALELAEQARADFASAQDTVGVATVERLLGELRR